MNFIRRLNKFLSFDPQFLKSGDLLGGGGGGGSWQQMQNFRTISPKLCQLGQKNTATWGASTTVSKFNQKFSLSLVDTW